VRTYHQGLRVRSAGGLAVLVVAVLALAGFGISSSISTN